MAILNVTPDSFSDGGKWNNTESARRKIEEYIRDGADMIDVGGESTRPGYKRISDQEEIERVLPVISYIKANYDIPVSVDTYKSAVASAALKAGADLVNDIWGLRYDRSMAGVIAENQAACCISHNRIEPVYRDFPADVLTDLTESAKLATDAGVSRDRIMIDPGIGFAKSYEENLTLLRRLDILKEAGYPILLGTSRKSVIGLTLDLPCDQRLPGTIATTVMGFLSGASFFRVHDVAANKQALRMAMAIMEA